MNQVQLTYNLNNEKIINNVLDLSVQCIKIIKHICVGKGNSKFYMHATQSKPIIINTGFTRI